MADGHCAVLAERFECGHDDVVAVDLEVLAQLAAEVGAAKTIGAQHFVGTVFRDERANLLGIGLHVIGRCHHRAAVLGQLLAHKRHTRSFHGVQHVVALGVLAVTGQLVEARAAPHIGLNAPVGGQQGLGGNRFAQDGARAQQLHPLITGGAQLAQIHALDDLLFGAGRQAWHRVVFVEQGDVIKHIVLLLNHALEAVVQDDTDFVGEGGVIRHAVGNGVGHDVAVTVFVLQAFAVERGAPRGAAQQEAARLHVARSPGQVANALEAEHRVVHIERHHDAVAGAVAGGGRDPAGHAAGFVDAFLQDLTGFVFLVVHDLVFVDRGVLLACRVVDSDLAEQAFHTESTGFIHQNRHHARA